MTFTRHILRICLALALSSVSAYGQSSRAEEISTAQAEKATHLSPETESRAEQIITRFALPGDPEGFYPFFSSPFPGGGFTMGVGYQHHLPRAARAGIGVAWTVKNYKLLEGRYGIALDRDNKLRVDFRGRYVDAPSVAYYGLGADSTPENRTEFGYRPSSGSATVTARPLSWLHADAGYTFQNAETTNDDEVNARFASTDAPGLGEDLKYNVYGGGLAIDTRPSASYADHGSLIRADWRRFSERDDKPFSFDQTELEVSQLVPLVGRHFVLAFRGLATFTNPVDGNTVPFMMAPHIGSGSTVRGFRNRRFQDRHRVVLNGEYRWQASRFLNMALFYDAGQVQPDTDKLRWSAFKAAWGIGARFHTPTVSVLRLEMARSREGWVLVAGASQAF